MYRKQRKRCTKMFCIFKFFFLNFSLKNFFNIFIFNTKHSIGIIDLMPIEIHFLWLLFITIFYEWNTLKQTNRIHLLRHKQNNSLIWWTNSNRSLIAYNFEIKQSQIIVNPEKCAFYFDKWKRRKRKKLFLKKNSKKILFTTACRLRNFFLKQVSG